MDKILDMKHSSFPKSFIGNLMIDPRYKHSRMTIGGYRNDSSILELLYGRYPIKYFGNDGGLILE